MQTQLFIIVPGIAGSKIYCNCNESTAMTKKKYRLYPRRRWFFNSAIDKHMYECPNISTKPLNTFWNFSIYKKLVNKLEKCPLNHVKLFSYDWRRDPIDIARDLLTFLKNNNPHDFTHIKLIGHSLGGLLIRLMIEYLNGLNEIYVSPEQMTVYQCGTPMYGSQDILDYNYGFELTAVLSSMGIFKTVCPTQQLEKCAIKKIKPFLFSINDLKNIIEKSSDSILYLLPTPIITTIYLMIQNGQLTMDSNRNFELVHKIHLKLSQLQFPVKYIFFFNMSCQRIEKIYIPFHTREFFSKITVHDIKPGGRKKTKCGLYLNRLMKSDGLVVPFSGQKIPNNCNIYVDESEKCKHAYLMNSIELSRIILNSHTFNYFNLLGDDTPPDDTSLPGYEDII